jgi:hypothetical protein
MDNLNNGGKPWVQDALAAEQQKRKRRRNEC